MRTNLGFFEEENELIFHDPYTQTLKVYEIIQNKDKNIMMVCL